jgi:quinol monooxygenase YgiN
MPPVKVTALLTARPGHAEELATLLLGMAPLCRAEAGTLRWDIWQDQNYSDRFVLDELYVDDTAAARHRDTAHYKAYLLRIGHLAQRTALVLVPVSVE